MRIAILRRAPQESFSMDVYADSLMRGLQTVRPDWKIVDCYPAIDRLDPNQPRWWLGVQKYYERYWRYPRTLRQLQVDLCHIIDHTDGYLCRGLSRDRQPNVITCHDLINLIKPETFQGRARFPLISMTAWRYAVAGMRTANHVITVSNHSKQDTIQYLDIPAERITAIANGVNPVFQPVSEAAVHAFRQQQGVTGDRVCILNVGSNNIRKNIATILEVVATLHQAGFPIHFWKVGADFTAPQKQFIQTQALESCITYLGQPDEETLITIYSAADVLLAPSTYEGFGLTVLEAMACGTPVIAANVTSLPEVAGDAAILVAPTDVMAIATAIRQLAQDPAYRQAFVDKGLERVKAFTWENTAEQVARVYERVLSAPSERRPSTSVLPSRLGT